ncbi:MAG: YjjG family noncanonical pyrimidine nucleotidase [Flavobacteriales bacterium]
MPFSDCHLFFDLDRTLWDFDKNSEIALRQLFIAEELAAQIGGFEHFHKQYVYQNAHLWKLYGKGLIKKDELRFERFRVTLKHFKIKDEALVRRLSDAYVQISPLQTALFPSAIQTLQELAQMGFKLHIITNGFQEVQFVKLENCGLRAFFDVVVCSEFVGKNKPDLAIFKYAMNQAGAKAEKSVMIGDDYHVDIAGALRAGMQAIWFDPSTNNQYNYENTIAELAFLPEMLPKLLLSN